MVTKPQERKFSLIAKVEDRSACYLVHDGGATRKGGNQRKKNEGGGAILAQKEGHRYEEIGVYLPQVLTAGLF